jgi:hypothetical protein
VGHVYAITVESVDMAFGWELLAGLKCQHCVCQRAGISVEEVRRLLAGLKL